MHACLQVFGSDMTEQWLKSHGMTVQWLKSHAMTEHWLKSHGRSDWKVTVQLKSNDFAVSCLTLIKFLSNIFRKMLMQNKTVFHDEQTWKTLFKNIIQTYRENIIKKIIKNIIKNIIILLVKYH